MIPLHCPEHLPGLSDSNYLFCETIIIRPYTIFCGSGERRDNRPLQISDRVKRKSYGAQTFNFFSSTETSPASSSSHKSLLVSGGQGSSKSKKGIGQVDYVQSLKQR
ncbi:hypothetical protein EVAR_40518_1 [Eumeta japonica]|uniref:Uncharacterized protein n=1 Tax=Eumeta variegata TaxID=151549 RepID=A0A4C2ABI7_EUMVA|nr:hypothetical protein EVAR_40518_1 [Eumeta japonica]